VGFCNVPSRCVAVSCGCVPESGVVCVPGCPVCQEIEDNFLPTASGDGLQSGVENVVSTFEVQSVGQQGDLVVKIVGMSPSLTAVNQDKSPRI